MDCSGNGITKTIIVDQSGKGNFKLIQDAIDSIKENNDQWVKVHIKAGTYREKVNISKYKPCVFLEGEGKDVTTITYGEYVNQKTWDNATFVSSPPNVIVVGITFENTYRNSEVSKFTEAPAAAIFGDKTAFYKSGFIGFQDTLLDSNGRHYFKYCYIQGEVDFIFGNGQSYYEECLINATQGKSPPGFITAQARGLENDTSGFVFRKGIVLGMVK
uniref:Pectinesterase n=1 Tax=Lupinus angustifolius TaxID=3871 RepID=Q84K37_LUPAN|nr:pectin methylesterase [Lupinus angustifolius]AAO72322.1 putative pectin methylesterase [Lupinus angustifolius]